MSNNAEEGIARTQAAAIKAQGTQGDRLRKHQQRSIAYLDERILTYLFALGFIGFILVWATATSTIVVYGSIAGGIVLIIAWGVMRVKGIEKTRLERKHLSSEWKPESKE